MELFLNVIIILLCLAPFAALYFIVGSVYYRVKARLVDRLEYTREFSVSDAFAGESIMITETLTNLSAFPIFFVDVESYIHSSLCLEGRERTDGMQMIISRFHLRGRSRVTRCHKITCISRGHFTMTTATVLTKGAGVEKIKEFSFSSELYVYPSLGKIPRSAGALGRLLGNSNTVRRTIDDPFSLSGVRDYTFGDPFNSINFKATARSFSGGMRGIKVNCRDFCCDRVIVICVDVSQADSTVPFAEHEYHMEKVLSTVASLVCDAMKNGYKVGFTTNCVGDDGKKSTGFPITGGAFRTSELLRMLARLRFRDVCSFASVLEEQNRSFLTGAEMYIFTESLDDAVAEAIGKLEICNSVAVIKA